MTESDQEGILSSPFITNNKVGEGSIKVYKHVSGWSSVSECFQSHNLSSLVDNIPVSSVLTELAVAILLINSLKQALLAS